jgi:hypothetical protein
LGNYFVDTTPRAKAIKKKEKRLRVVAQACNPTWEAEIGRIPVPG